MPVLLEADKENVWQNLNPILKPLKQNENTVS